MGNIINYISSKLYCTPKNNDLVNPNNVDDESASQHDKNHYQNNSKGLTIMNDWIDSMDDIDSMGVFEDFNDFDNNLMGNFCDGYKMLIDSDRSIVYLNKSTRKIKKRLKYNKELNYNVFKEKCYRDYIIQSKLTEKYDFIPRIYGLIVSYKKDFIITQEYVGEDLFEYFFEKKISFKDKINVFCKTVFIINELHNNSIYHGDIKLENICWDKLINVVFLIDFEFSGLAQNKHGMDGKFDRINGTFSYMAPELISDFLKGKPSDIWGLGCILYQIITDANIIEYKDSLSNVNNYKIANHLFQNNKHIKTDLLNTNLIKSFDDLQEIGDIINLIESMLMVDYKKRINCNDVINHNGFQTLLYF